MIKKFIMPFLILGVMSTASAFDAAKQSVSVVIPFAPGGALRKAGVHRGATIQ